jgi:hypothetical protein
MHDVFTVVQGQDQQGAQGIFSANREFHGLYIIISIDLINIRDRQSKSRHFDLQRFRGIFSMILIRYMIKSKSYLLCLLLAGGCCSTSTMKNQPGGNPSASAQEPKQASKEASLPRYSHETVTEATDGGTKFLELVSSPAE